ncbi:COG4315 family predicted lipoprotein [Pseudarthrobacter sp. TAF60_1]|uniref:COG4315 family predicted lipoprotein n=1 Tax=Pseudarthrobacter sp. TAF60_1 TaxID=3233071 RepID=UPI003F9C26FE
MKKHLGTSLAAMALMAALAGCGGSPGTTTTTAAPATSPANTSPATSAAPTATTTAAPAVDLMTASSSAGKIVVDAKGMSLYVFTKDTKGSGTSACTAGCLTTWPRALTVAATPSAEGVTGALGTITTPDGAKQLTLNGLPLYYYAKDKKPGDVGGQGVGGAWYLLDPAGEMIKTAAPGY